MFRNLIVPTIPAVPPFIFLNDRWEAKVLLVLADALLLLSKATEGLRELLMDECLPDQEGGNVFSMMTAELEVLGHDAVLGRLRLTNGEAARRCSSRSVPSWQSNWICDQDIASSRAGPLSLAISLVATCLRLCTGVA